MQNASYPNIKIKYDLLVLRFFRNRLEILLSINRNDDTYQIDGLPFINEKARPNLQQHLQDLMPNDQDWQCGPTQDLVSLSSYNTTSTHELHRVTWVCLTPKHNHPSKKQADFKHFQSASDSLQWYCVQKLLEHNSSTLQCSHEEYQSPAEKYHRSCISWIQHMIKDLQALSQTGTIPLSLLTPTFRFRHARFLYSQIWGESINPQAFKAWMRKSQALHRVGPSRYEAKDTVRKPWQIS